MRFGFLCQEIKGGVVSDNPHGLEICIDGRFDLRLHFLDSGAFCAERQCRLGKAEGCLGRLTDDFLKSLDRRRHEAAHALERVARDAPAVSSEGRCALSVRPQRIGDVEGGRQFPTTVVVEEEAEILPVVVFVSAEVGKNSPSEQLLHFRLRLREPAGEPHQVEVVENGFPEVDVQKSRSRDVVHAACWRPVEPFHPEPVGNLGTSFLLRSFKKFPHGRADAGLFGDGERRGFEDSFFVAERKVGRGEFDESGRHAFLRDKRCPGEIVSEPELRLGARTARVPAGREFSKKFGLFFRDEVLGGSTEFRDRKSFSGHGRNVSDGCVGQCACRTVSDISKAVKRRDGFARHARLSERLVHEPEAVPVRKAFRKKTGESRRALFRSWLRGGVVGGVSGESDPTDSGKVARYSSA